MMMQPASTIEALKFRLGVRKVLTRVGSIASSRAGCPPRLHVAALESRLITCHHTDGEQHPTETILGYRETVSDSSR